MQDLKLIKTKKKKQKKKFFFLFVYFCSFAYCFFTDIS